MASRFASPVSSAKLRRGWLALFALLLAVLASTPFARTSQPSAGLWQQCLAVAPIFVGTLVAVPVLIWLIQRLRGASSAEGATAKSSWFARHPKLMLVLIAAGSVLWQLHPVVFCGKSFVSPDNATYLLYDHFPTLPGYKSEELEDQKGSDIVAFMCSHLHTAALQNQALREGELPLWNRYDLCGVPLLGQGQTMFGELLQWIPIMANGTAWSWDVKFVLSRWLYAFGAGLAVWLLTRHLGAAGLIALAAPWIGYFFFRANHPAQFAVAYGPWIIVGWALLTRAVSHRNLAWSALVLFAANWEVLLSGSVKEAYMMLPCANLAGLTLLFATKGNLRESVRPLLVALTTGVILVLVSTPIWLTFLDTLAVSKTSYDAPAANQIPMWQLIGLFDDMVYRHFMPNEIHGDPSANAVVLFGVLWLLGSLAFRKNRAGFALFFAALVPLAIAFEAVPASWIVRVPLLANIHHVGNTFSCAAIVLLTIAAGVGFADFLPQLKARVSMKNALIAGALFFVLVLQYLPHARDVRGSAFYNAYLVSILGTLFVLGLATRLRRAIGLEGLGALAAVALGILLWRHGQYVHTSADAYVFNPKIRADLSAPSPAIERLAQLETEPMRIAGLGLNLYTGTQQLYLREGIYGIDAVRNRAYDDFAIATGVRKVLFWGADETGGERNYSRGAMDLLNVRYYLDHLGNSDPSTTGLSFVENDDMQILESKTAWPRAFFTNRVIWYRHLEDLSRRLLTADGKPFAALASDDHQLPKTLTGIAHSGAATIGTPAKDYRLTSNTTQFTVEAATAGVIVLSEVYYPKDFRVYLNDQPATYFPVNYAFKGVLVTQPGTYTVRYEYWPHHLTASLLAAAVGVLLGGVLFIIGVTKKQGGQTALKSA
ncbi:MAG TPA: hypothetical protein VFT72_20005 [Opitutaceae bacterium]|nr:hypothetical protein [Opitutaceae bacterium]